MVFISSPSFSLFLVISYPSSVLLLFAPFIAKDVLQTHPHNYRCSPILFCIWALLQHTFISNPCLALWCCRRGGASLSSRSYRASGDGNLCKDVALLQPEGAAHSRGSQVPLPCWCIWEGVWWIPRSWSAVGKELPSPGKAELWRQSCGPLKPARCFILCYKMSPPPQDAQAGTLQERPFSRNRGRGFGFPFSGL